MSAIGRLTHDPRAAANEDTPMRRTITQTLIGLLWLLLSLPGWAHQPSDAFLTLTVGTDGRIEQRLDIALRDLDLELDLDADGDGQLRWGELRARWGDVERLIDGAVQVSAQGTRCSSTVMASPQLDERAGVRHAVTRRTLHCGGNAPPAAIAIDYRLMAQLDATHRGLLRIDRPGQEQPLTQVLVPGQAPTRIVLETTPTAPGTAASHGLTGFFVEGLAHIAAGADHILFIVTLLLVVVWRRDRAGWKPRDSAGGAWREALRLVTAFTVSHSVTLGLAAAGVVAPPTRWVETGIAISVLLAAIDNLRPFLPGPRWISVAIFGLVHGFGLAGPLQSLGLQGWSLAGPLLAFNLGVEAGQGVIVVLLLPLALWLRSRVGYRRWVVQPASLVVASMALWWTVERVLGGGTVPV